MKKTSQSEGVALVIEPCVFVSHTINWKTGQNPTCSRPRASSHRPCWKWGGGREQSPIQVGAHAVFKGNQSSRLKAVRCNFMQFKDEKHELSVELLPTLRATYNRMSCNLQHSFCAQLPHSLAVFSVRFSILHRLMSKHKHFGELLPSGRVD